MPQAAQARPKKKKSPAQLDREIALALRRKSTTSRPGADRALSPARGHARVKAKANGNGKQEEILMVANDAALSDQHAQAEKILGQGKQRTIATAFTTVTPESAAAGDYASRGWEDQDGDAIEVTADDIAEAHEMGSHAPVTDAIVEKAVQWLRDHGASGASSTRFQPGTWYETEFEMDYSSGEEKQEEFFLRNFTTQEEQRIFDDFKRGRR